LEQDFLNNLDGSSLGRVELIMAIEEVLGDYVPPEDERKIRGFRTIQEAIDYLEKRRRDGGLN
jgi:acyl carrier protein